MNRHNPQGGNQRQHTVTSMDTATATAALRSQMRVELIEVEDYERRKAIAFSKAPNQQANFLLAASYLIQENKMLTATKAVELVRTRYVEGVVQKSLQHIKEKWHREWYHRPKEFTLGDQSEKELAVKQAKLYEEEKADLIAARNMIYQMINFITFEGKLMMEWKKVFREEALIQHNGNVWTAKRFEKMLVKFGPQFTGTGVPEGMGETIFQFLDTKETGILPIQVFYDIIKDAAGTIKKKKRTVEEIEKKDVHNENENENETRQKKNTGTTADVFNLDLEEKSIPVAPIEETLLANLTSPALVKKMGNEQKTSSPYAFVGDNFGAGAEEVKQHEHEQEQEQEQEQEHIPSTTNNLPWYKTMFHKISKMKSPWSKGRKRHLEKQKVELLRQTQEKIKHALVEEDRKRIMKNLQLELEEVRSVAKTAMAKEKKMTEQMNEMTESQSMGFEDALSVQLNLLPLDLYKKGAMVRVNFAGRGHFYPARIVEINHVANNVNTDTDTFKVQYMDGDREVDVPREHLRYVSNK